MEDLQKVELKLAQSGTPFIEGDTPSNADSLAYS